MSLYQKGCMILRQFYHEQRGAFALSFVMLSGFMLSLAALAIDGSHYITERARLSDALEQTSLALSAEDNGENSPRNQQLATYWIQAYMGRSKTVYTPKVIVKQGSSLNNKSVKYVEYRVSAQTLHNSWFSSSFFPSFQKNVVVGDNGAARKFRSNLDVVFVVDFSGSMNNPISTGQGSKLDEAKKIVLDLADQLYSYNVDNSVAFVPFGWGVRRGDQCRLPFQFNASFPEVLPMVNDNLARGIDIDINYRATVNAIPDAHFGKYFPMDKVAMDFCLNFIRYNPGQFPATTIPLKGRKDAADLARIKTMTASDRTLVSGGMLDGISVLAKGDAARKIMVVVSDGEDFPNTSITPNLVNNGMCDKIREILATPFSQGKIAFIALDYNPTFDWTACVGKGNFYEPKTLNDFKDAMNHAVFEEVGHNTLKDR
nr:TadE/TadG family type IV pilus assembly protein [Pantoea sp. 201603H]